MFLLVPAQLGSHRQRAVKLLLLMFTLHCNRKNSLAVSSLKQPREYVLGVHFGVFCVKKVYRVTV